MSVSQDVAFKQILENYYIWHFSNVSFKYPIIYTVQAAVIREYMSTTVVVPLKISSD